MHTLVNEYVKDYENGRDNFDPFDTERDGVPDVDKYMNGDLKMSVRSIAK